MLRWPSCLDAAAVLLVMAATGYLDAPAVSCYLAVCAAAATVLRVASTCRV